MCLNNIYSFSYIKNVFLSSSTDKNWLIYVDHMSWNYTKLNEI